MEPLCESFLTAAQLGEPKKYYPLHVRICDSCWLAQLPEFVSPAYIFTKYANFSSLPGTALAAGYKCQAQTRKLVRTYSWDRSEHQLA